MIDLKMRWSFYSGQDAKDFEAVEEAPPRLSIEKVGRDNLLTLPGVKGGLLETLPDGWLFFSPDELSRVLPVRADLLQELIEFPQLHMQCRLPDNSLDTREFSIVPDIYVIADAVEDKDFMEAGFQTIPFTAGEREYSVIRPYTEDTSSRQMPRPDLLKQLTPNRAVMPGFRDNNGHLRLFVPGRLDVWFKRGVEEDTCIRILKDVGLEPDENTRPIEHSFGLWRVRVTHEEKSNAFRALSDALVSLQAYPEVVLAEPDELSQNDFPPTLITASDDFLKTVQSQWPIDLIGLKEGHKITTGSADVVIYVIDSGIDTDHPNIAPVLIDDLEKWDLNFDVHVESDERSPEADGVSHGTAVVSLAIGQGKDGPLGVAPSCRLAPIKIAGEANSAGYGLRAVAIHQALDMIRQSNKKGIINLSWKTAGEHLGIREALRRAQAMQVPVTVAAGNYNLQQHMFPNEILYPAAHSYREPRLNNLVSVGAVNASLKRASYSYYGETSVTVAAPGGELGGAGTGIWVSTIDGGQAYMAGTSFAAPQVAGLLALLLGQGLSTEEAIHCITDRTLALDDEAYPLGHGLINVPAALGLEIQSARLVNINTADINSLAALSLLTRWHAQGIVDYRAIHGPYASPWHLSMTGRFSILLIQQLLPFVTV